MNFNILFGFFLLFCISVSAQEESNALNTRSCNLLQEFGAMTEKLKAMEATLQDTQTRLQDTETKLQDNVNQMRVLRNKEETKVVFSAALGGPERNIGPFNTNITLAFRKVNANIGNAYNAATGIFTAPVAGVYYFSMFLHAGGFRTGAMLLFKNSKLMLQIYEHPSNSDRSDNGGNAGFLLLQRGDQVYVQLPVGSHVWANNYSTTFSGFLANLV